MAVHLTNERSSAEATFESFFRAHYGRVVAIATRVLRDRSLAEDVAQEVFAAVHARFDRGTAPESGWVSVAAVHRSLNVLRGDRRRSRREQLRGDGVSGATSAEDTAIERAERDEVRRALARMSQRSATVLLLRHSGLSYAEVAAALGVGTNDVGTMLRRAEHALRKEVERARS